VTIDVMTAEAIVMSVHAQSRPKMRHRMRGNKP
jgi:hypothetical protein